MTARIGADDVGFFESPRTGILREISGVEPEPSGVHVLLDKHLGVRSTQRLALGDIGGDVLVALWPGELKPQAVYLYADGRGAAMVAAARERGWDVRPSPHLAFFNSPPERRLYMAPDVDTLTYAERWEGTDGLQIAQHSADDVRASLWPWLKERGYADPDDDRVLEDFLAMLGRRFAHLRPGMRFKRRWSADEVRDRQRFTSAVRGDVNAILEAAGEPLLPGESL